MVGLLAGTDGSADDASKNDDGGGISGTFDAGEQEEMEDAFAALSASGDSGGIGGPMNDGGEGGGGDEGSGSSGAGVDASFSAIRPDDDGTSLPFV